MLRRRWRSCDDPARDAGKDDENTGGGGDDGDGWDIGFVGGKIAVELELGTCYVVEQLELRIDKLTWSR